MTSFDSQNIPFLDIYKHNDTNLDVSIHFSSAGSLLLLGYYTLLPQTPDGRIDGMGQRFGTYYEHSRVRFNWLNDFVLVGLGLLLTFTFFRLVQISINLSPPSFSFSHLSTIMFFLYSHVSSILCTKAIMIAILCTFFPAWYCSSIYIVASLTGVILPAYVVGFVVTSYVRNYLGRGEFSGEFCHGVCATRFCKRDRISVGVWKRISCVDLRVS